MGYRRGAEGTEGSEGSEGLSAECRGWELRDQDGDKIGKVDEVFVDENDRPEYLGVKMGLLGNKLSLIPADLAQADGERRLIEVSDSRDRIKDAPVLGANEEITAERERGIRDHFGLDSGSSREDQREQDEDTSELSSGQRQGSEEDRETRASDRDASSGSQSEGGGATGEREPWSDTGDSSAEPAGAAAGADADYEDRDHESPVEETEKSQNRNEGSGAGSAGSGSRETMRVSVWREKARAEKVLGEDGSEEVRIRKEWVEEEDIVEVEDHRQR